MLVKLFMVLRERRKPVITGMFFRQTAAAGPSACAHRRPPTSHRGPKSLRSGRAKMTPNLVAPCSGFRVSNEYEVRQSGDGGECAFLQRSGLCKRVLHVMLNQTCFNPCPTKAYDPPPSPAAGQHPCPSCPQLASRVKRWFAAPISLCLNKG